MPTNKERREVASQIKETVELFETVGAGCPDYQYLIMGLMNLNPDFTSVENRLSGLLRLADLIEPEPEVDRDALLYIAQDLEVSVMDSGACGDVAGLVLDVVAKIRKACGEIE